MKKLIGRPPKIKEILKSQKLRRKGLTYRDIALVQKTDVKTVFRWVNYDVGKIVDKAFDIVGKRV